MFATARIILGVALALGLTGCDFSQKKPETVATRGDGAASHAGSERSVRLYGPGVSRQRQTRI